MKPTMKNRSVVFSLTVILLLGGYVRAQTVETKKDSITRKEVLRIAESYVRHEWRASVGNEFHGVDKRGVQIDTPDQKWWGEKGWYADGRVNVGIPYCWSGESTLEEFDQGLLEGRPAGYVFRNRSRPPSSSLPIGVDCSGLVSVCWKLKTRRATSNLAQDCLSLDSYDDLLPGDVLNRAGRHVMLFKEWVDDKHERLRVIEATFVKVREKEHDRATLTKNGFLPLRYRGMSDN
jgi:hypothetical protein